MRISGSGLFQKALRQLATQVDNAVSTAESRGIQCRMKYKDDHEWSVGTEKKRP
jgi:hypothetical protein